MDMSNNSNNVVRYLGAAIFSIGTAFTFWVFFSHLVSFLNELSDNANIIYFNRGVIRLFGASVILLALTSHMIAEIIKTNPPGKRFTQWVTRIALAGLAALLILPHIVHYPIERMLFDRGYKICEPKSHQWLANKTIAYANSVDACLTNLSDDANPH